MRTGGEGATYVSLTMMEGEEKSGLEMGTQAFNF